MVPDSESRKTQKQDLAAEILRSTGKLRLAARGHSMLPTFWPGDLLDIETIPFDQVSAGDVVLYRRWGRFFIHRVLCKLAATGSDRPSLVTRGDSMAGGDAPVVPEELLGKVVSVQRTSGVCSSPPRCSKLQHLLGLILGYSDRLRSLALRYRAWRARSAAAKANVAANEVHASQLFG